MKRKASRVVNLRYTCEGLRFDAAIDCDWFLHAYGHEGDEMVTPIELYCFDHPDWDIRMLFYEEHNDVQDSTERCFLTTCADMDFILEETRKWIKEMEG